MTHQSNTPGEYSNILYNIYCVYISDLYPVVFCLQTDCCLSQSLLFMMNSIIHYAWPRYASVCIQRTLCIIDALVFSLTSAKQTADFFFSRFYFLMTPQTDKEQNKTCVVYYPAFIFPGEAQLPTVAISVCLRFLGQCQGEILTFKPGTHTHTQKNLRIC